MVLIHFFACLFTGTQIEIEISAIVHLPAKRISPEQLAKQPLEETSAEQHANAERDLQEQRHPINSSWSRICMCQGKMYRIEATLATEMNTDNANKQQSTRKYTNSP